MLKEDAFVSLHRPPQAEAPPDDSGAPEEGAPSGAEGALGEGEEVAEGRDAQWKVGSRRRHVDVTCVASWTTLNEVANEACAASSECGACKRCGPCQFAFKGERQPKTTDFFEIIVASRILPTMWSMIPPNVASQVMSQRLGTHATRMWEVWRMWAPRGSPLVAHLVRQASGALSETMPRRWRSHLRFPSQIAGPTYCPGTREEKDVDLGQLK